MTVSSQSRLLAAIARRAVFVLGLLVALTAQADQFTLNVVDNDGNPVNGFRWLLQEDATFPVDPNNPATTADELLSLGFHASYHPIAQDSGVGLSGNTDTDSAAINAPAGRYYVSVLPYSGHSISGQPVEIGQDDAVTVVAQQHPIPTATIALFVFQDHYPISGAPDLPEEDNPTFLPDGTEVDWTQFNILVEEPAGRYGIAGGQVIQDAFGNPLGTTYDEFGDVVTLGDGTLQPNADGTLLIKNLAPGKYGIVVIPPTDDWQQTSTIEGTKVIDAWVKAGEPDFFVEFGPPGPHVFVGFLKSTADGGFPPISQPPGTTVTATLSGTITDMHLSRPPTFQFFSGRPFPACWVGLNDNNAGLGAGIYAAPCDDDSGFSIPGVPPGSYQLKVFDANMDVVIATMGLTVNDDGSCLGAIAGCDFGDVPVFNWFTRLNTGIFNDDDQNGFWDDGEIGIGPESHDVSVRWRDGSIYLNFPTDGEGLAPFDEIFPFFHWLVAEVSFANKKATGATYVIDAGGEILADQGWIYPSFDEMTPQPQICTEAQSTNPDDPDYPCIVGDPIVNPNTGNNLSRTEVGQVLTNAFQGFLGQTSVMQFGKTDYLNFDFSTPGFPFVGENGGISGIVYYATTRAEDDPRFAAAEEWEPGVPRVQLALYADGDIDSFPQGDFPGGTGDVDWNGDGILDLDDDLIDDINGDGVVTLADVDNYPFGWSEGGAMGPEDVENSGADGMFDLGDAVQVTWTDSWDDNIPTGCQGQNNTPASTIEPPITDDRCFDGLRNFNQVRPGVFDGGYAFADYDLVHLTGVQPGAATAIQAFYDFINTTVDPVVAATLQLGLIPGDYIVEAATPPGYKLMKEEDKNVDFGDEFIPDPEALAAACVGEPREVPPYFSMSTKDGSGALDQLIDGIDPLDAAAPFAGDVRPLCDLKKVPLSSAQNAAAEFFLMTDVPVVGNVSGVMLNDLANEFNPNSPAFGEKFAPPLLPVAFYDFNGKLVNRIYGDTYGRFNLVVPSTYTANLPQPSGMSPNMLLSCMNDAGPIDDGTGNLVIDPFYDPQYSQFCYTFQYMPGVITYLDTPVVSIAAFTTPGAFPVDCERPTRTPMIASVTRTGNAGNDGPFVVAGTEEPQTIQIDSMGRMLVPNPEWDGVNLAEKNIQRDYRFDNGDNEVFLEAADGTRTPLDVTGQNPNEIFAEVPIDMVPGDYQVVVISEFPNMGKVESPMGLTLTVGACLGGTSGSQCTGTEVGVRPNAVDPFNPGAGETYAVHRVAGPAPYPATPIQDAIDLALSGDLIMVPPGSYEELVIMWKPVKLQGWGPGDVFLNARQVPTEKIEAWREKVVLLADPDGDPATNDGDIDLLPGQENLPGFAALAAALFPTEEGAGIFVAGKATGPNRFVLEANRNARVDGFNIFGASTGGGIVLNGYNQFTQVGNNRLSGNAGFYAGGIRAGHPTLVNEVGDELSYTDALNDRIRIHHNHVAKNGGFGGAGGGVSINTGADNYRIDSNWVCGNFTQGDGAGIGHLGLSNNGLIEDNFVIFNESFAQANAQSGGGISIAGQPALVANADGLLLSPGTGRVIVDANLIRGNLAGAGDGGGIRIANVNGEDVAANLDNASRWYWIGLGNNMINNNVAGLAGGGISIQDALRVFIFSNTVANNDSTATTADAFVPGVPNVTVAQPAGIVSRLHSPDLTFLMADVTAAVPADWLTFSDPLMRDDIVYNNRSFYWTNFDDPDTAVIETGLVPATCVDFTDPLNDPTCDVTTVPVEDYTVDLAVLNGLENLSADPLDPTATLLDPRFSLLTDTTGYHASNITGDPDFVNPYFNGSRDNLNIQEFTTLQTAGAFDEGGNFIQVTYGPLSLLEPGASPNPANNTTLLDYHIGPASVAIDVDPNSLGGLLALDFDNEPRPQGDAVDIGADEAQ
ncbi:MAG: hypothetical protein U9Q81_11455 [Pseudomonadota bacterium]|nr:hypothetical protein [Pseudomonadota bacterium]